MSYWYTLSTRTLRENWKSFRTSWIASLSKTLQFSACSGYPFCLRNTSTSFASVSSDLNTLNLSFSEEYNFWFISLFWLLAKSSRESMSECSSSDTFFNLLPPEARSFFITFFSGFPLRVRESPSASFSMLSDEASKSST